MAGTIFFANATLLSGTKAGFFREFHTERIDSYSDWF